MLQHSADSNFTHPHAHHRNSYKIIFIAFIRAAVKRERDEINLALSFCSKDVTLFSFATVLEKRGWRQYPQ